MKNFIICILIVVTEGLALPYAKAQNNANYDESKVPAYELPPLLIDPSGKTISTQGMWETSRRGEILSLFETFVYGKTPENPFKMDFKLQNSKENALGGKAIQKEIIATFRTDRGEKEMTILIFLPKTQGKAVPLFLGLNFSGNHTIHADPGITITQNWVRNSKDIIVDNKATELSRGLNASRWHVEEIIERGYGLATIYSGDLDPDYDDQFQNGIHPLFYKEGQEEPQPNEWGTIGAWAWGLSRAMDYLETDPAVDSEKVMVMGHSRLGKAALWAGVQDTRFAMVISNNSGCGGAALFRRRFGETVKRINRSFPHWFCKNFHAFNGKEAELPIDQHMLIALVAPRAVYAASAEDDLWADPKGEFLSLYHAGEVYRLFGHEGIKEMPKVNDPVIRGKMGYHIRSGGHDVTLYDWGRYMDFADHQFKDQ